MDIARLQRRGVGTPATDSVILGALTTVGRAPGNTIVLDDPRVSRHHLVIRVREDGGYVLSDLGSSNGTIVNGRRVLLPERLHHDDELTVGSTTFVFLHQPSSITRAPTPDSDLTLAGAPSREEVVVVGTGPAMEEVFMLMRKAASSDIPVLIQGETGTGKELVAHAIHKASRRSSRPFVAVNCAALPETLLESELFGHRRGAFTGAERDRVGLFEAANAGTIFLDEVGEMPFAMQAKLLRVLQEGEITPIGDSKSRSVDVHVISATNRDLGAEVEARRFRNDLFYRLSGFPITLPALRDRKEDIPVLAGRFLTTAAHRHNKAVAGLAPATLACLCAFDWPGNVRELQNEIQRATLLAEEGEAIGPAHLSPRVRMAGPASDAAVDEQPVAAGELRGARAAFEARHIADVLRQQGGNVSRAAQVLGLSRMQLHRKIKEYRLR